MKKMKNMMKRVGALVLTIAMVFTMLPVGAQTVEAAAKKPTCAKNQTVNFYSQFSGSHCYDDSCYIFVKNITTKAKITDVTSSNKKITPIVVESTGKVKGAPIVRVIVKVGYAGGKATIKFKVKQNGKTYSLKCKVTCKRAPYPFKSLKIGGKEYATKTLKSYPTGTKIQRGKSMKISVTPKKNIKVKDIFYNVPTGNANDPIKLKYVKNGGKVNFSKELPVNYLYVGFEAKSIKKTKYYNKYQQRTIASRAYGGDYVILEVK